MKKKLWAKGRKERTCVTRLDEDVHEESKEMAKKYRMSLKAWVSSVLRREIILDEIEK